MCAEKEDLSLDEVCSDVLYKIPLKKQSLFWQNAVNASDPVSSFRHRHPALRLYLSVHDSFLATVSLSEATFLVTFLKKMNSSGLDVIVNPETNLAVLSSVLHNYQQMLSGNSFGLSITVDSRVDISQIAEHGIEGLVDNIFFVPNTVTSKDHEEINIPSVNELSANKLMNGLSSVVFVVPESEKRSNIPSFSELCSGSNLNQWKPKIQPDDQVVWKHSEKKWKFAMQMGLAVANQMKKIRRNNSRAGILLFDVPFRFEDNPICSRHRTLFIDSLREALGRNGYGTGRRRVKRDPTESLALTTKPQMKLIGESSQLGKVLVFAVGDEDEQFRKHYRIHDEDSLLKSPVDHIVLGYDDSGTIYDIYQPMPREISQASILNTIHRYYVDKILGGGGGNVFGAVQLHPPNILVYPEASGNHPVPILVTWVRVGSPVARLTPRKTRKQSSTTSSTTSIPSTTQRMGTDSQNPFQQRYFPAGLMEILNLKSRPSATTTTRQSTAMRQTTTKPLVPMNPQARVSDSIDASLHVTKITLPEMIPSPQTTPSSTLLLLANEQESKLPITNRMASPSKRQLLCNGESANSYLSCKTRNRRFVDTRQFKRPISKAQFAMSAKSRLF